MKREFAFIDGIRQRARARSRGEPPVLGIGDDAAVLAQAHENESLLTADLLIEDIDFKREYVVASWLGHKALAVSLSDIAAMGGRPRFSLLTLGIPAGFGEDFWDGFFEGYFTLAERFGISLIGGDTSASPERLVLDSIVVGSCARGQAVRRSGAQPGDDIWVTGTIGASHVGLNLLLAGERVVAGEESARQRAMRRHLCPEPPIEFGRLIGESGLAHSMIDISDGLAQDLAHICESSGVSAEIDGDLVPIAEEVQLIAFDSRESLSSAISGGEDYELLFTAAPDASGRVRQIAERAEVSVAVIGRIIERSESTISLNQEGQRSSLRPMGYQHFSSD